MKRIFTCIIALLLLFTACAENAAHKNYTTTEIQQRLIDKGYLHSKADGTLGRDTVAALRMFQYLHVLDITGEANSATCERLFSDDIYTFPAALRSGDSGEAVLRLQQRLIELDFLQGEADGIYGKATAEAVTGFQARLAAQGVNEYLQGGLVKNVATGLTQAYLFDPYYSSYLQTFREGDDHEEIARIERRLAALKYLDTAPDSVFDAYTAASVSAFQTNAGLEPTGEADKAFVDALFNPSAPEAANPIPHDVTAGDTGLAVKSAQETLIRLGMLEGTADSEYGSATTDAFARLYDYLAAHGSEHAEAFAQPDTLTVAVQELLIQEPFIYIDAPIGADSDESEVLRLQRRLNSLCYLPRTKIDGVFGPGTVDALKAFLRTNGLEESEVADEAAQRLLFSDAAVPHKTPYMLEVSIADQRVYVNELGEDGEYTRIHEFVCSTGLYKETPRGVFLETGRISYWHNFTNFDEWAQYSYQIEGPILFHSYLYREQDESTVDEISKANLGRKASHGCVRLTPEDAGWIFENCAKGTIVRIY